MFLKTVLDLHLRMTALLSPQRWSLAARLSVWYSVSMFVVLLVATTFLYWTLARSFDREDDQYLTEKITVLQTLLADRTQNARMIEWEIQGEAFTRPASRVLSRVLSGDGLLLTETHRMSSELPPSVFPGVPGTPAGYEIKPGTKVFRVMSARVATASPSRETYQIQVATDLTSEKNLLAGYRRQLWLVLVLGLIGSVLIGYRIGYRGIAPVEEIAGTMQRIGSETLDRRMELAGLPSELSALASPFNQMLDRLEDAFARLSRFSSDIAHELRTPIGNLRGEVEVALAEPRPAEEYHDVLASLLEEFLRLSRLIDSLLFLARSENPHTQIQREPLEIARELNTICEFYEAPASDRGVSVRVAAPRKVIASVDRTLLQRAVGNLIENALAHTPRAGQVSVEAVQEQENLLVTVSDTGCGIPESELPLVFDRFHRVDAARSKGSGGLGLGLAIVKSIAALHGGKVSIESRVGDGTRVTLFFPGALGHREVLSPGPTA
jgi:two-component system heavy metal sensor histidine kinase CusS